MVLVRKSELACRNFMDQALWEPAEHAAELAELPDTIIPDPSPIGGEMAPDVSMESSTRGRNLRPSDHTDQITSIGIPLSGPSRNVERARPAVSFGADRSAVPPSDAASALRDAQSRRKQQFAARRTAANFLPPPDDFLEQSSTDHSTDQPAPAQTETALARPARLPMLPDDPDDATILTRSPKAERRPLIPPPERTTASPEPAIAFRSSGVVDTNSQLPAPAPPSTPEVVATENHTEPLALLPGEPVASPVPPVVVRDVNVPERPRRQLPSPDDRQDARGSGRAKALAHPTPGAAIAIRATPAVVVDVIPITTDLIPYGADPIDGAGHLAIVPRCCASCRDFVAEGDGSRGRCRNAYALVEQRMVKSDELACRSSIGTWWLPRDDLWLERADMMAMPWPDPLLNGIATSISAERVGSGMQRRGDL